MPHSTPKAVIPSPGGEVVIATERQQEVYDTWKYAPARRAGDYVYVSGVVIARPPEGPHTQEAIREQTRAAFERIGGLLAAFGVGFSEVVMINSFHDWSAPEFGGDRKAQFDLFSAVKDEFMAPPHPAWTAVGTSGLIRPEGVIEVQMIAYAPHKAV